MLSNSEIPKYVEGMMAICFHCGFASLTFNRCQRCRKNLPEFVKSIPAQDPLTRKASPVIKEVQKCSTKPVVKAKSAKRPRTIRKNRKLVEDPVVLTLSSNEEDQKHNEMDTSTGTEKPFNNVAAPEYPLNNTVSASAMGKEPFICENESTDNSENSAVADEMEENELNIDSLSGGSTKGIFTSLQCRTVRIGSYEAVPTDEVILSSQGMQICVPGLHDESVKLHLKVNEIVRLLIHFGRGMPVLFFYVVPSAAGRIRHALKMESKLGPYYDPASDDDTLKLITLLPERFQQESKVVLKTIFDGPVLGELNNKEAKDILVRAGGAENDGKVFRNVSTKSYRQ